MRGMYVRDREIVWYNAAATAAGSRDGASVVSTTRHLTLRSSDIPHSGPPIYRNRRSFIRGDGGGGGGGVGSLIAMRPACS